MKLLKQEVDMLPKDTRKDAFRRRKEEKEVEHAEKVRHQVKQLHLFIPYTFYTGV